MDGGVLHRDTAAPFRVEHRPAAVALALRIWSNLHGLVSLEIYGQLQTQALSPEKLFRLVTAMGVLLH